MRCRAAAAGTCMQETGAPDPTGSGVQACAICVDAKTDYPAACNSVEKVLVHRAHERAGGIFQLQRALREAGVTVYGTDATTLLLGCPEAPSLRHEYGTPEVTVDLVDSMDEAIDKIHTLGSGHTEVRCVCCAVRAVPGCKRTAGGRSDRVSRSVTAPTQA